MVTVKIDSCDKDFMPTDMLPEPTPGAASTVEKSHGHENHGSVTASVATSLKPVTIGGTLGRKHTGNTTATVNNSGISLYVNDNFAEWSYSVDDEKQQKEGIWISKERRPIAPFSLRRPRTNVNEPLKITLSSVWVLQEPPFRKKMFDFFFRRRDEPIPLLRNFRHLTVITLPPNSHELPDPPGAKLKLRAEMPSACICPRTVEISELTNDSQFGVEMMGLMESLDPNWTITLKEQEVDHPEAEAETIGPHPEAEPTKPEGQTTDLDPKGTTTEFAQKGRRKAKAGTLRRIFAPLLEALPPVLGGRVTATVPIENTH